MSYLVLARKWRPQSFADLVGQDHVGQTLENAIRTGRIHHAFLFTGARGVGKTSAARIFAKALNCEEGLSVTPCDACASCKEIAAGQGVDVFEIDGASNTGVDDIRELRENIRYLPSRSRYKIFIIDEVHMLSINAFNALLKTLEEPPAHAKFIFATTEPHKIPTTILSRCQRFDFRKIALPKMLEKLRSIVDAEGVQMSDRSLTLVARRGEGSMRDALSTLDQVVAFCGDQVLDEDVQGLLGMVDRRLLQETAEALIGRDSRQLLEIVRRVDDLGHSFRQFAQELVELIRALVICRVVKEPAEVLDVTGDELAALQQLAEQATLEDHQRILAALVRTEAELANSPLPMLTLEMALVRLAQLPPSLDVATLLQKLDQLEKRLAAGLPSAVPPPASAPAPPHSEPPLERRREPPAKKPEAPAAPPAGNRDWPGLVEFVRAQRRPMLASVLDQASLISLQLPTVEIGLVKKSFALAQLEDRENLEQLEAFAGQHFGQAVKIVVCGLEPDQAATAPPSLQKTRQEQESDRKRRLREDALNHPVVKSAQEIFAATVQDVRPIDKGFV